MSVDIILYKAEWCGYCKAFKPEWDKLVELVKNKDYDIKNVTIKTEQHDVDEEGDLFSQRGIKSYPTIHIVVDGKVFPYELERTAKTILEFVKSKTEQKGGSSKYFYKYLKYKSLYLALKQK